VKPARVEVTTRRASPPPPWLSAVRSALGDALAAALDDADWGGEAISVALVDDPEIARLHGEYLDEPTPTDVMSFDLRDPAVMGPFREDLLDGILSHFEMLVAERMDFPAASRARWELTLAVGIEGTAGAAA